MNPGHVIYDRNVNDKDDSYRDHLPGADYLYKQFSYFAAEHRNKIYFSGNSVKGSKRQCVACCIARLEVLRYYSINE